MSNICCKDNTLSIKSFIRVDRVGKRIVVEDIPLMVCTVCGEKHYEKGVLNRVEELVEEAFAKMEPTQRFFQVIYKENQKAS